MRHLIALSVLLLCAANASAARFWLSGSNTSSAPGEVPMQNLLPGQEGWLHIWGQPDEGQTLRNVSLNAESDAPGVIAFTSARIFNPYLGDSGAPLNKPVDRYEYAVDSDSDPDSLEIKDPNTIRGLQGYTVTNEERLGAGIGPNTAGIDPGCDAENNSWYFGSVHFDAILGRTAIYLTIGENGINNEGGSSAEVDVFFGDSTSPLNALNDRELRSGQPDAMVVVPEPSTLAIATLAVLGLLGYGWRRL